MHAWHDIELGAHIERHFRAVIEIPKGSKIKYELDKRTGMLWLDRVLHSAVHYPANYGFLPRTYCGDDDPSTCSCSGRSRWCRSASCARGQSG